MTSRGRSCLRPLLTECPVLFYYFSFPTVVPSDRTDLIVDGVSWALPLFQDMMSLLRGNRGL